MRWRHSEFISESQKKSVNNEKLKQVQLDD